MRSRPWIGFGILWFFLQLAPTNSIVPRLDVANDRQLYLAGWGLFLGLGAQISLVQPSALGTRAAVGALLALCALASIARQLDYASETALWEASVREAPWNARAHNNLGYAYQVDGRVDEAEREYRYALIMQPGYAKARLNLDALKWDRERAPRR